MTEHLLHDGQWQSVLEQECGRFKLRVSRTTLGKWRTAGRIDARICNNLGEWLYKLPADAKTPHIRCWPTTTTPLRKVRYERRSFRIDVLLCAGCGGRMSVVAFITDRKVSARILEHLGLPTRVPPVAKARAPPSDALSA